MYELRRAHFKGNHGKHGKGQQRHGTDGKDIRFSVPVGTEIHKIKTKFVGDSLVEEKIKVADLDAAGEEFMVAKGGFGGEGNHKRKTKNLRSRGMIGETIEYELKLKLFADVGFVGFPNAGKSTLLTAVSSFFINIPADPSLSENCPLSLYNT